MPITFSVTCDSDAELARFLENFRYAAEMATGTTKTAKASSSATAPKSAPVKKETTTKPAKKAATAKSVKVAPKPKKAKPLAKAKTVKTVKAATKTKAPKAAAGRKPGKLTPIIEVAIKDVIKKGKPFRSKDVTELVMKKSPDLNESSVTTGVSKLLSETSLKYDSIKDAVGRPYKLYKP
jgi:hypothetical protein